MYYVYVVGCADHSLYTGTAKDPKKRVRAHVLGLSSAAKYTKSHPVTSVEAVWEAPDKSAALRLEARFKRLSREQKLAFLRKPGTVSELFGEAEGLSFHPVSLSLSEIFP